VHLSWYIETEKKGEGYSLLTHFLIGRSYGPTRAKLSLTGLAYAEVANAEVAPIVMIETKQGLDNCEEIVSTPGIAGVYIGPADLAGALGLPYKGDTDHPLHIEAVAKVLAICKKHRVPAGIHTGSAEWTQRRLDAGFDFVTLGIDLDWMVRGAQADLAKLTTTSKK
jgi:4-hydroxy-2-oxoheptanedioate aldolase